MGGIQIITPKENIFLQKPIPRLKKIPTKADINQLGENPSLTYHGNEHLVHLGLRKIIFLRFLLI